MKRFYKRNIADSNALRRSPVIAGQTPDTVVAVALFSDILLFIERKHINRAGVNAERASPAACFFYSDRWHTYLLT